MAKLVVGDDPWVGGEGLDVPEEGGTGVEGEHLEGQGKLAGGVGGIGEGGFDDLEGFLHDGRGAGGGIFGGILNEIMEICGEGREGTPGVEGGARELKLAGDLGGGLAGGEQRGGL